jgi:hypothetical protein
MKCFAVVQTTALSDVEIPHNAPALAITVFATFLPATNCAGNRHDFVRRFFSTMNCAGKRLDHDSFFLATTCIAPATAGIVLVALFRAHKFLSFHINEAGDCSAFAQSLRRANQYSY